MASDPKNFQGLWRSYLRIKVAIDVRHPLKSKMRIKKSGGDWIWIHFKYERLPSFCFFCGIIGHPDKFSYVNLCLIIWRDFDSSLRAPMGKQQGSRCNQWLREENGNKMTPAKSAKSEGSEETNEVRANSGK